MDSMILGETIQLEATGQKLDGHWMPAGGNDGVGGVEVFYVSRADVFKVHIDTKKSDETDAAASSIGSVVIDVTTPKLHKFEVKTPTTWFVIGSSVLARMAWSSCICSFHNHFGHRTEAPGSRSGANHDESTAG
jgi:hypothetical protein